MTEFSQLRKVAKHTPGLRSIILKNERLVQELSEARIQIDQVTRQNSRLERRLAQKAKKKTDLLWPIFKKDLLRVEFDTKTPQKFTYKHAPPFKLNWVVLGANVTSGGQEDIFRTIQYLSSLGHDCHIYVYDVTQKSSKTEQQDLIHVRFKDLNVNLSYNAKTMRNCDAIFATHWITAYHTYNFGGQGKKYYYVQDFEPFFEPAGYKNYLADKTYSFGFKGLTLGPWLASKLSSEYKMPCDYFDFGYDPGKYFHISAKRNKDILYYMRPTTPRRGVELAIVALELFHAKNPESRIHLFGTDTTGFKVPFPHVNHGVLDTKQLNNLYNACKAGLILSFTNMSLIPLEMLAAGCVPVVNEAKHTRMVKYADQLMYARPNPQAIADALDRAIRAKSSTSAKNIKEYVWDKSNQRIEDILKMDLS